MINERQQAKDVNNRSHLTIEEVMDVLQTAKNESVRDWAMLVVCFRHALRSAEVAGLRWEDIDFANGTLSLQRLKGGLYTEQPLFKTKGCPVLDEVAALKAWRNEQTESQGNPYVFTTQKSAAHISRETISRLFKMYAEKASAWRVSRGKKPIPESCQHVHILRHTRATLMANTPGVNIYDVKAVLGHAQISSTMRYAHHDQRKACDEAERSIIEALA
jgi:type 1 fimbriae regulatory protein FimB